MDGWSCGRGPGAIPGCGPPTPSYCGPSPHRPQPFCWGSDSHTSETSQASFPTSLSGDHLPGHQPDFTAKTSAANGSGWLKGFSANWGLIRGCCSHSWVAKPVVPALWYPSCHTHRRRGPSPRWWGLHGPPSFTPQRLIGATTCQVL